MRPIVDGLQAEFGERMVFVYSNALLEGKQALERLALPGHPSFVLFSSEQTEVYRTFGEFDDDRLRDAILSHLSNAG